MKKQLKTADGVLEYELIRKRVRNINLRVKRDGTVSVSAPTSVPEIIIESFILQKYSFILSSVRKMEKRRSAVPQIVDGAKLRIFDRDYIIVISAASKNSVSVSDDKLLIALESNEEGAAERLYKKWLKSCCHKVFTQLCKNAYKNFEGYVPELPDITVRDMVSRWGSCSYKKNRLTFSARLAYMPLPATEYVVYHEFVHFIHQNHSADFYKTLESFLPDWKIRNKMLK